MTSTSEIGLSVPAVYRWGIKSLINGGQKIEPVLEKLKVWKYVICDNSVNVYVICQFI